MQKRDNKTLIPFLITGELFVLYISYIISGVWKKGMDVMTLLDRLNEALAHPFNNYFTANAFKAMAVGTLIYANGSTHLHYRQEKSHAWQGIRHCKLC